MKRGRCEAGFIENLPYLDTKFDVIIMSHVFEHLVNCKDILLTLKKYLTNNGILYLEIPNCDNHNLLLSSINNAPHIHHFTKKSIQRLAENANYKIIDLSIFSCVLSGSYLGYIKHLIYWILKKDFYFQNTNGEYLRTVLTPIHTSS